MIQTSRSMFSGKNSHLFFILIFWLGVTLSGEKIISANQIEDSTGSIILEDSTGWSEPVPIPVHSEDRTPVIPNIVQSKGSIYVTYQTSSKKNPFPRDVWVIENKNGRWKQPQQAAEASLVLTGSKIAVTERNGNGTEVEHLVWTDQPSDTKYGLENPPPVNASNYVLYSYRNQNREIWSVPDTLYHTPRRSLRFSPNLISKKESLYFVFSAFDSTDTQNSGYKSFLMIKKKNHWMLPIAVATLGGDADMEILEDGTFLLSYIRPDTTWVQKNLRPDVNSVFVKTSSDGGKTWNESRMQRSGRTPAYHPNIESDGSGKVHLLWRQDTDGDRRANNLAHSWTEDGEEWSKPEMLIKSFEDSGFINNFDVVTTNSGRVHLLFVVDDGLGSSTGRLYHAYWNDNSWKLSKPLFDFPSLSQFSLAYDESRKQIHLVFMAIPDNQDQEALWRLYHSVYQD